MLFSSYKIKVLVNHNGYIYKKDKRKKILLICGVFKEKRVATFKENDSKVSKLKNKNKIKKKNWKPAEVSIIKLERKFQERKVTATSETCLFVFPFSLFGKEEQTSFVFFLQLYCNNVLVLNPDTTKDTQIILNFSIPFLNYLYGDILWLLLC